MSMTERNEHGQIPLEHADYAIHSYHTDVKQQVNLPSLFLFLQESAWHHAAVNDFGWEALNRINCIWALARIKVLLYKYPAWTETVRLETWSKPPEPLMAYRDFEVRDGKGDLVLSATSAWLVIDATTRRPQRVSVLGNCFPILEGREAIRGSLQRIAQAPADQQGPVHSVPFSAIDINGHVNNTNYVKWVLDAFPFDYLRQHNVYDIEINYLQESRQGDQYRINTEETAPNEYLCNIIRQNDGKELVRMKMHFEQVANEGLPPGKK